MAKEKQWKISANTTEEGLGTLRGLKERLGVSWDELIVGSICAQHGLDAAAAMRPRAERPAKVEKPKAEKRAKAEKPEKRARAGKRAEKTEPERPKAEKPKAKRAKAGKVKVYKDGKLIRTETAQGETVAITASEHGGAE